jgi:TolA-binding protein
MKKHVVIGLIVLTLTPVLHAAVPRHLNAFTEGDRLVYTRVIEAYRRGQLAQVLHQRQVLERNYPNSVHLDNAYYLSASLEYQAGHYAEAVRDFSVVTDRFPQSNKRPAALFAKAMTYEKLGLKVQAARLLNSVVKQYPGSQESQRAWMQLKVASLDSHKR